MFMWGFFIYSYCSNSLKIRVYVNLCKFAVKRSELKWEAVKSIVLDYVVGGGSVCSSSELLHIRSPCFGVVKFPPPRSLEISLKQILPSSIHVLSYFYFLFHF